MTGTSSALHKSVRGAELGSTKSQIERVARETMDGRGERARLAQFMKKRRWQIFLFARSRLLLAMLVSEPDHGRQLSPEFAHLEGCSNLECKLPRPANSHNGAGI